MCLNELFDNYISYYELILSPSTLRSDIATYNKHFKNSLGLRDITEINFIDIQKFCNGLIKQEYKIKTIKNIVAKLKVIFKLGIKLELILTTLLLLDAGLIGFIFLNFDKNGFILNFCSTIAIFLVSILFCYLLKACLDVLKEMKGLL